VIHLNEEMQNMPQEKLKYEKDVGFIFIKQWVKTSKAIMFSLSNKLFQVNFFDNSQILLHTAKKTVLFTSKHGEKTYEALSNVLQTQENEITRRIKYTKDVLNSIKRKKDEKDEKDEKIDEIQMAADK
jgi:polo-like kinase 1